MATVLPRRDYYADRRWIQRISRAVSIDSKFASVETQRRISELLDEADRLLFEEDKRRLKEAQDTAKPLDRVSGDDE